MARGLDDRLLRPDDLGFKLATCQEVQPALMGEGVIADSVSSLRDRLKVREMLAVSTLHYSERSRPSLRTSLPNVYVVNSAQIANGTLNVNETVALANSSAHELRSLFQAEAPDTRRVRQA